MRLHGFDYSRSYYYMVTIRCLKGLTPLSMIIDPGICQMTAITRAFVNGIREFHLYCRAIEPIRCFTIMPDHIHLIIRIGENENHLRLEAIVNQLMTLLEGRYQEITHQRVTLFDACWHDWIILRRGQLAAFTRYIVENPKRRWIRMNHPDYFRRVVAVDFLEHAWYGYGNVSLLNLPVLRAVRCSRIWKEGDIEWTTAVEQAKRIGPCCAGIGTFMSPCEKACGHEIGLASGNWIILHPEGFPERWHPSRRLESWCARGRMLFLSLYPPSPRRLSAAELSQRCHEMGDLVVSKLGE